VSRSSDRYCPAGTHQVPAGHAYQPVASASALDEVAVPVTESPGGEPRGHGDRSQPARIAEVFAIQPDHVFAGHPVRARLDVHQHALQVVDGGVAQITGVLDVERDGRRAAELIADVLALDRDAAPSRPEAVIRLLTSPAPTLRAVSKPKVGVPPGSGRSLSMVFGTCTTPRPVPAAWASRDAENAVSSPPIVISAPMPSFRNASRQAWSLQSGPTGSLVPHCQAGPRGPDDRPAPGMDPRHVRNGQRPDLAGPALEEVLEAVHDPEDVPPGVTGLDRRRRDHRVHPRGATTAQDPQAHALIVPAARWPGNLPGRLAQGMP
jgi:hypothetical protein